MTVGVCRRRFTSWYPCLFTLANASPCKVLADEIPKWDHTGTFEVERGDYCEEYRPPVLRSRNTNVRSFPDSVWRRRHRRGSAYLVSESLTGVRLGICS
ncbi:hypothetical protein F5Y15DRAFT_389712 [Xylariaceae sp. FL0016]|nr:hypothetical protein F5Y15DRAFT_389712 [Xylariaceae sp. FL0016]